MSKTPRQALLASLRSRLFPALVRLGFSGPEAEEVKIDDIAPPPTANLFHFRGVFDGRRCAVTVDVKSFNKPTFTIVAGRVPPEGVKRWAPEGHVLAEDATADMLEEQAYLQCTAGSGYSPFAPSFVSQLLKADAAIERVVDHAVSLLPQLVAWLQTGTSSEHIRVVRFPRPKAR